MDSAVMQHAAHVLEFVSGRRRQGHELDLNAVIAGSWRRCALDYSLDPARHYAPTIIDSQHARRSAAPQHADLVQIASAEIDWLYDYIAESGYALVLTDASGVILYEKTDQTLAETFRAAGLMIGADWSEQREGTNGIGTCIAENRPIDRSSRRALPHLPHRAVVLRVRRSATRPDRSSRCWTRPR